MGGKQTSGADVGIGDNPDMRFGNLHPFHATMLPVAYAQAANDTCPFDSLLTAAEETLRANRHLVNALKEKRAAAKALSAQISSRTAALQAASDTLLHSARDLLGIACTPSVESSEFSRSSPRAGRLRLVDGHEVRTKECLARIAAELAGREPDERVRIELAGYVAFDDEVWRYPDFLQRAEKAFSELAP